MNRQTEKENLEGLINEHSPRLKSFIQRRVPNREDAEDILQDVFYQLIKTVESVNILKDYPHLFDRQL